MFFYFCIVFVLYNVSKETQKNKAQRWFRPSTMINRFFRFHILAACFIVASLLFKATLIKDLYQIYSLQFVQFLLQYSGFSALNK